MTKSKSINIRVGDDEHERIKTVAKGEALKISTWARQKILKHVEQMEQTADMKRILSEQRKGSRK